MGRVSVAEWVRDTERRSGELSRRRVELPRAPGEKAKVLTVSPETVVTASQRHGIVILSRLFFAWDHPLPLLSLSSL